MAMLLVPWRSAARKEGFSVPPLIAAYGDGRSCGGAGPGGPLLAPLEVYLGGAEMENALDAAADEEFAVGIVDVAGGLRALGEFGESALGVPVGPCVMVAPAFSTRCSVSPVSSYSY
ncbi:hypothetical protein [Streptomyces sp. NPDC002324]